MNIIKEKGIQKRFEKSPSYFASVRSDLFSMIPSTCSKILDVGCGAGEFWKNFKGETVGIELDTTAAALALKNMNEVHTGDIEVIQANLKQSYFDCVIFADVLEHLYDPWGTLLKYSSFMHDGGHLLISVPNIQNYRVLRSLVFKGEFGYEESGILDIDHIRFFTRKELLTLIQSTGFEVVAMKRNFMASAKYLFLNRIFFGLFDDFLTGQYYFLAKKSETKY